MDKKTSQIGIRLEESLYERLRAFESETGLPSSAIIRALIEAMLDYYDTEKQLVFPIACISKKSLNELKTQSTTRKQKAIQGRR